MTESEYEAHKVTQRLLGMAQVHTMLMQMRLDVLYRGPGRPIVRLNVDKLLRTGEVVWKIKDDAHGAPLWDAAETVKPLVDRFAA